MTPSARVQAAIELLDAIIAATREGGAAADTIIHAYFKQRRYAGSSDRRAVRELVYRAIRRFGEIPASGRAAMLGLAADNGDLGDLFDGSPHGPAPVISHEPVADSAPIASWITEQLDPLVGPEEYEALLARAPLDIRVNRLKGERHEALAALPDARPTPLSPLGMRLHEGFRVEADESWRSGLVEIQDEGSQLVALACGAETGSTVVDLCAGAGGKSLAIAGEMANRGHILACDIDRSRLSRLEPRAQRAGAAIIECRLLDPPREIEALSDWRQRADVVLVDAPCSGSGTWRRNPETRWRLTPARLERLVASQAQLLDVAAELVRPGGHLIYAVCSLLSAEGREQAENFCRRRSAAIPDSSATTAGRPCGPGRLVTPAHDDTDGFFIARWKVTC